MTYQETLKYLYDRLPMFYRVGAAALKPNLNNITEFCNALQNPQRMFKTIHIAGTNGKGSTSHMLASILQENGYKTGLYTSPHLKDFRERIRINGKLIPKSVVTNFIKDHSKFMESLSPSFFEWTLALAFSYFQNNKVDIAVIETGLGGRLDSTNIILPELSIITNISWDHMDLLGDTLQKIAFEKAGIIKPNTPVVISERQVEIESVFIDKAKQCEAPIEFASDYWSIEDRKIHYGYQELNLKSEKTLQYFPIHLDLPGSYQQKNIQSVFSSLPILEEKGIVINSQKAIRALRYVKKNTGLRGRWDLLSRTPLTICDTGHNIEGIREVVEQIRITPFDKLHFVFGVVKDKDLSKVLSLLPKEAEYYFCQAQIPRALEVEILLEEASQFGLRGEAYKSVRDAYQEARKKALKNPSNKDLVFIGGSTFVVAEIIP